MKTDKDNKQNLSSVCRRCRRRTDAYISDTLSPVAKAEYDSHINECEACRRYTREMSELSRAVARSAEDIPDGLHERIMAALASECRVSRRNTQERAVRAARALRVAATGFAAVFCVCFLLGAMLVLPMMTARTGDSIGLGFDIGNLIGNQDAEENDPMSQAPALEKTDASLSSLKQTDEATKSPITSAAVISENTTGSPTGSGEGDGSSNSNATGNETTAFFECETTRAAVTESYGVFETTAVYLTTVTPTAGNSNTPTDALSDGVVNKATGVEGIDNGTVIIICAVLTVGSLCAFIVTLIELKRIKKKFDATGDGQKSKETSKTENKK